MIKIQPPSRILVLKNMFTEDEVNNLARAFHPVVRGLDLAGSPFRFGTEIIAKVLAHTRIYSPVQGFRLSASFSVSLSLSNSSLPNRSHIYIPLFVDY